jgi:hypothetical protein
MRCPRKFCRTQISDMYPTQLESGEASAKPRASRAAYFLQEQEMTRYDVINGVKKGGGHTAV